MPKKEYVDRLIGRIYFFFGLIVLLTHLCAIGDLLVLIAFSEKICKNTFFHTSM